MHFVLQYALLAMQFVIIQLFSNAIFTIKLVSNAFCDAVQLVTNAICVTIQLVRNAFCITVHLVSNALGAAVQLANNPISYITAR